MVTLASDRLELLLSSARGRRIAVLGDVMLDVYLAGSANRISPEAPVPVVNVEDERFELGGAANVAANVVGLGATCDLIGAIGADPPGQQIRRAIATLGGEVLRPRLLEIRDRPTTTKTRVMARHHQVARFDREVTTDLPDLFTTELRALLRATLDDADVLVLEDYNKGVLTDSLIRGAIADARSAGCPVVVDPKFRNIRAYRGATVMKPNVLELSQAFAGEVHLDDDAWLDEARAELGCDHLLVTLGERGLLLCSMGEGTVRIPALARRVFDVSGAGDTVAACLAVAMGAGADMREAAALANMAAGIEVGKPGVATVSPAELVASLAAEAPLPLAY
jgi:rfaE bifunctional protein kinase chain/domain